jgi:uncharacterized protein (TIGR01244 family)
MSQRIEIEDGLIVHTSQPSREELAQLAPEGFKAVANLRMPGEQNQPLSPEEEGEVVRQTGMTYVHVPVASTGPQPEQVDRFREELARLEGPVLVHCASGKRSGAFALLYVAARDGLSGDETLAKAKELGFDWKSPELEDFVRHYRNQER